MISSLKKALGLLIVVWGSTSIGLAQSAFFEVVSTPYDHQMERVQPTLKAPSAYALYGPSLDVLNQRMMALRTMPYRFSHQWQTPFAKIHSFRLSWIRSSTKSMYSGTQRNA